MANRSLAVRTAGVRRRLVRFLRENALVILAFAAVLVLAFAQGILDGYVLSPTSMMYRHVPWSSLDVGTSGPDLSDPVDQVLPSLYSAYSAGDGLSLWDPYLAFGSPTELFHLLFPLEWLYALVGGYWFAVVAVFKFAIALAAMYAFLRSYELGRAACVAGSVSFAFSSSMVAWLCWPHSSVVCLAPLLLLSCKRLFEEPSLRRTCWFALVLALMLLAGMPTFVAMYMYLAGAYLVFLSIKHRSLGWRRLVRLWLFFIVGCVAGAVISLPYTYQLLAGVGSNGYAESRSGQSTITLVLGYLRTLFLPYEREGLTVVFHFNESTLYTGLLSVVLAPFAFVRQRQKKGRDNLLWSLAWVVLLLLIFSNVLDVIFTRLPLVSTSPKVRVITLFNFVSSVLVAVSLDDLARNRDEYRKRPALVAVCLTVPLAICGFAAARYATSTTSAATLMVVAGVLAMGVLVLVFVRARHARVAALALIVAAAAWDSASFAQDYLTWVDADASVVPEATSTIEYLQEGTADEERYLCIGSSWTLFSNANALYGLYTIEGHGFVNTNEDMQSYLTALCEDIYITKTWTAVVDIDNINLARWAGIKYVVSESATEELEGYELVYEGDDGLFVYETDEYAARAYLATNVSVFDSADEVLQSMASEYVEGTAFVDGSTLEDRLTLEDAELGASEGVQIVSYDNDSVTLEVTVEQARLLVLSDYYDEDWAVYIDGERADIVKANYLFRGVVIEEAGTHTVEFRYEPVTTYVLLGLSGVTFAGTAVTCAICTYLDGRRERALEDVPEHEVVGAC